jgi:hypothetical protein
VAGIYTRGFMTLVYYHASATQALAWCLTPWFRWTIALSVILLDVMLITTWKPGLAFGGVVSCNLNFNMVL